MIPEERLRMWAQDGRAGSVVAAARDFARELLEWREVGKWVEWAGEPSSPAECDDRCPACDSLKRGGHAPDCKLARLLGRE